MENNQSDVLMKGSDQLSETPEQQKYLAELQNKIFQDWIASLPKGMRTLMVLNLDTATIDEFLHSSSERNEDEDFATYRQRLNIRNWLVKYRWKLQNYSGNKQTKELI